MIQLSRAEIEQLVTVDEGAVAAVRDAYVAITDGRGNVPPVGHIAFPATNGDCHIKYGHIAGDPIFAVKIAAGFYDNPAKGLPSSTGIILAISAETGEVRAILNDEGYLTDLRTGIGGAVATLALARDDADNVLIVGTGIQARYQSRALAALAGRPLSFRIWGRSPEKTAAIVAELARDGLNAAPAADLEAACRAADIIVTTTPSTEPLVRSDWVRPGTHITAMGADGPGKQELDTALVARADVRVSDMKTQSLGHGEFSHACLAGLIGRDDCIELGAVLAGTTAGRRAAEDITIADLTGVATQDIAMARTVLERATATQHGRS
ncbi:ornithine cyclodeaminase [Aquamicrobium lusatiense]|uniref:Ornithine cyclodeaminase n=1 Tax=Aquamicrobium lusatiense TaxID=89772 RepID=A0A7W9S011_9HYPH|nr:ornithine cyclodeaminase family protein [Aquamicrobium lusatiense]MBB6011410.1 ornithine cyclodeaminase [Aquamicrobium lusatiense]